MTNDRFKAFFVKDILKVPQISKPSADNAQQEFALDNLRGILINQGILLNSSNQIMEQSYKKMLLLYPITTIFTLFELSKNKTLEDPNLLIKLFQNMAQGDPSTQLSKMVAEIETTNMKNIYTFPDSPIGPFSELQPYLPILQQNILAILDSLNTDLRELTVNNAVKDMKP